MAVFFLLLATSCSKDSVEPEVVPSSQNLKAIEAELLDIVNDHRSSMGFAPLEYSAVAYDFASVHTDYMISQGGLSHDNFTARASDIASETNAEAVAENVAKDYSSAVEAFEGWLNSASHRKTIEGNFTHTGISVKKDVQGNYYYTQLFYR